ncbi:DNA polymerase delta subunit 2 [Wyeomyia smithii]|uniref:DNA polymerase delta subunit 2 n=1 Tax=Wyeomyia smithii TaxID=174621 RepID=UPI0024680574|nr:DNA polymerase delta subunit 2 [Wyeomyia smithii]
MLFPEDTHFKEPHLNGDFKRLQVSYVYRADKFHFKYNDFSKQFAYIYASRLEKIAELMKDRIKEKWGDKYPVKQLADLKEESQEQCIIIGTLFKHQELKPSILKEISEENQLVPQPPRSHYSDDSDILILEDALQRIRLTGKLNVHTTVTGIVCAVLGYEDCDGRFQVDDYIFYECGPQKPLKTLECSPLVVLISGLNQSSPNDHSLPLELLQQWIFGNLEGFGQTCDWEAASIVRVIIAGNSIKATVKPKNNLHNRSTFESNDLVNAVQAVDFFMYNLSQSVNVDLMPGEFDPANHMLPQQPMHHCMFPKTAPFQTFRGVPNPYACEIANRFILGTSGQNVLDITRYSKIEDPLEALKWTLVWSHLAPTAPDTLPCYPYYQQDPFIIDECPHVYFAGNTDVFRTDVWQGSNGRSTRLICVPSFAKTCTVAVVNLRTLECEPICFKVDDFDQVEE